MKEIRTVIVVCLSSHLASIVLFKYANETVDSIEFHSIPNQKVHALG
jgi:hypothetical protein